MHIGIPKPSPRAVWVYLECRFKAAECRIKIFVQVAGGMALDSKRHGFGRIAFGSFPGVMFRFIGISRPLGRPALPYSHDMPVRQPRVGGGVAWLARKSRLE